MAQRVVGGGERYVSRAVVSLDGVDTGSVIVPPGANAARIQPQLFTNLDCTVIIARGTAPTIAGNELALDNREVLMDTFQAGETIAFQLVDIDGNDVNGGAKDSIVVVFYTNIAGRPGGPRR